MKKNESSVLIRAVRPYGVAVLLSLVVGLVLVAFAWPGANTEPRDVPVGLVASDGVATQVQQRLEKQAPGAFEIQRFENRGSAEQAIRDRDVYGAIVVSGPGSAQVLTASGGSAVVAQTLTQLGAQLGGQKTVAADDIVPASSADPRGSALGISVLPLVLGGMLTTLVLDAITTRLRDRVGAVVTAAAASGIVVALVLHTWLEAVNGSFWNIAGVAALGVAAVALTLTGLDALLGRVGLGLGAAVMLLLANPLSGLTSAPEMLPSGWSQLGQVLPLGAYGSAMRSVGFFDGAAVGAPLLILACWVLVGLVLVGLAALRRSPDEAEQPALESVPV